MPNIKIDLENTQINFNDMMIHSDVVEDVNKELEEKSLVFDVYIYLYLIFVGSQLWTF